MLILHYHVGLRKDNYPLNCGVWKQAYHFSGFVEPCFVGMVLAYGVSFVKVKDHLGPTGRLDPQLDLSVVGPKIYQRSSHGKWPIYRWFTY